MSLDKIVYKKLLEVPRGKVTTYSELAKAIGVAKGQRFVGNVMNKNPYPIIVPCHRVVKSDGTIGGYAYGNRVKENLLKREGIKTQDGKILDFENKVHRFKSFM